MIPAPQGWDALVAHIGAHPVEGAPADMRAAFEALSCGGPSGHPMTLGGIECRRHGPDRGHPILWLHGGGLVFGSPASHAAGASHLSRLTGRPVILPAYRLAPEHPWPAPLEDAAAVLRALGRADVVGDSAGGMLALNLAQGDSAAVTALGLISPNTDRTGASLTRRAQSDLDLMNDDATDLRLARMAFGEDPAARDGASPLQGDLSHLPPVWITAATSEVLLDDTLLLVRALGLAGRPVEAHVEPGLCHMWTLWPNALDQTRRTYASLAEFLNRTTAEVRET
ncbi:alpha/beta hydrolase [Paracoccus liaowanqingii]|uniref:Alpha/beta hydrolase n=1 Tax=Paracoccus liaowanqingii TaxID=2560053 RepID=A0A4P7HIN2_9RHOB|nr:alpha/beta hydrolase fold domain-containing protein [Paracoccus liaowanqingii]QBX33958.1 alpha/beta hydrolase [Paracoccus liaowanqingii]